MTYSLNWEYDQARIRKTVFSRVSTADYGSDEEGRSEKS
jgi:hypothetical protein